MWMTFTAADVDLTDSSLYRDGVPHEVFAAVRRAGPVHRHPTVAIPTYDSDCNFW